MCWETGCDFVYEDIGRRKMREIHKGANPDVNLQMMISAAGSHKVQLAAHYIMFSNPVEVRTFQVGNYMAVVDFLVDTVTVFDRFGKIIVQNKFNRQNKIKDVGISRSVIDILISGRE